MHRAAREHRRGVAVRRWRDAHAVRLGYHRADRSVEIEPGRCGRGEQFDRRSVEHRDLDLDRVRLGAHSGADLDQPPCPEPSVAYHHRHSSSETLHADGVPSSAQLGRRRRSGRTAAGRARGETEVAAAHRHDRAEADVTLGELGAEGAVHPDRRADARLVGQQARSRTGKMSVRPEHPSLLGRRDDLRAVGGEEAEQLLPVVLRLDPIGPGQPVQLVRGQRRQVSGPAVPNSERWSRVVSVSRIGAPRTVGRRDRGRVGERGCGVPGVLGRRRVQMLGQVEPVEAGGPGGARARGRSARSGAPPRCAHPAAGRRAARC